MRYVHRIPFDLGLNVNTQQNMYPAFVHSIVRDPHSYSNMVAEHEPNPSELADSSDIPGDAEMSKAEGDTEKENFEDHVKGDMKLLLEKLDLILVPVVQDKP